MKLSGVIDRRSAAESAARIEALLAAEGPLVLDLSEVTRVDSAGAALIAGAARRARERGREVQIEGLRPEVEATFALLPDPAPAPGEAPRPVGALETLGERALAFSSYSFDVLRLAADVTWFTVASLFTRRGLDRAALLYEMSAIGSRALGVVGLISFLVGGTMALQSAFQLRQFGANIFVVDLVAVSITRELGPLITAIVVAGRSGSAITAELATMTITEEVDALQTMGIQPVRFLVVPKALAITLTQPLLTVWSEALAIGGGFLVAVSYLEVGPESFVSRLEEALYLKDMLTGLVKSVVFAALIVLIASVIGLRTKGGADAVGRSTTSSVVASIFAVIVADAAASLVFYFQG